MAAIALRLGCRTLQVHVIYYNLQARSIWEALVRGVQNAEHTECQECRVQILLHALSS